MNINLFLMLGGGVVTPTIQITTPAYLDPAKMRVGDVIGSAFTSGVYPDFQGIPVVEATITYTVDDAPVLATYVLQSGDLVGQAEVTLSATGADDLAYFSEITGVTDFSFAPTGLEWVVPAGTDTTAPVISSPVDAANGATAATGSVSTDEGNGTLYWVVSTSGTAPTKAQVKAGQMHTGAAAADAGSQAVSATGVQTLSPAPSGLAASTAYTIHFMHEDAAANQSTVASGDGFTTTSVSGPTLIASGNLINTSAPGTTPPILTSITALAGDIIVLLPGTCRNSGGSAMALSATWNGEAFTEDVQLLHSGGRATGHVLTLVCASGGTFTPVVTCSNSAAAVGCDYFVIRGQSGTPKKQTPSNTTTSGTTVSTTLTAPNTGAILLASACQRYNSTNPGSSMTAGAPWTQDSNFRTGTSSNLDLIFSAAHHAAPSTTDVGITFTSDGTQNITLVTIEIF